jgi:hypothetical protein
MSAVCAVDVAGRRRSARDVFGMPSRSLAGQQGDALPGRPAEGRALRRLLRDKRVYPTQNEFKDGRRPRGALPANRPHARRALPLRGGTRTRASLHGPAGAERAQVPR